MVFVLSLSEARVKENLSPIEDDFLKLSLGSILFYPDKRTLFVPNMSTVFSSETNKIIDSPQMIKDGDHRLDNEMNNPNNNEPKPVTTDEGDNE